MRHIDFLVEEPSMEALLRALLPRMLTKTTSYEIYSFQGKQEMLKLLPDRLKGYSHWLPTDHGLVILIDRDQQDCKELKKKLLKIARSAKIKHALTRIAIEELEAWYFGDWKAVRKSYPKVDPNVPQQSRYRDPDAIRGGTWEAFERILKKAGYFTTGLRKLEVAREIGQNLNPSLNSSRSFQVFRSGVLKMTTG